MEGSRFTRVIRGRVPDGPPVFLMAMDRLGR